MQSRVCFADLPDEALVIVARCLQVEEVMKYAHLNKSLQKLIMTDKLALHLAVQDRNMDQACSIHTATTWKQVAWFEEMKRCNFFNENRLGFAFGSVELDSDRDSNFIANTTKRIHDVKRIWRRFHADSEVMEVNIYAHSGTLAPPDIAPRLSRARGISVSRELGDCMSLERDVTLQNYGRRVADLLSLEKEKDHPYSLLARQGLGWVEVYMTFEGLELPPRPQFYERVLS